jgi:hypothetical protein
MNHPKINRWGALCAEYAPHPDTLPALLLRQGRETGNGGMRVLRTRIPPFPELIPPFPSGRGVWGDGGIDRHDTAREIKFGMCHVIYY